MDAKGLQDWITHWTVENSGHEFTRQRMGLSNLAGCDREVYDKERNGRTMTVEEHLRTRLSFELQNALIERLRAMGAYGDPEVITLADGAMMGHTDGRIGDDVLEIKTVAVPEHFPMNGRLPTKVYTQVQGYMHYLRRSDAYVIYLARSNGEIRVYHVRYNPQKGQEIEAKVNRLVNAWQHGNPPACTCGECQNGNGGHHE